ncbi:MAG: hypothetical protein ACI376_07155 [Candidatus Bruticola sp.]
MARSGFKGRERVWQSYSKKLWTRILKDCKAGLIEVRADLHWFHKMFEADPEFQVEIFGRSYPEVKQKLAPWAPFRIGLLIISLFIGTYGAYEFCQNFFKNNSVCLILAAALAVMAVTVFVSHVKSVYEDPKDLPLIGVYLLAFLLSSILLQSSKFLIVALLLFLCSLVLANVELWILRKCIIKLICSDYEFFKQSSGRPNESNERPPICFLKFAGEEQRPLVWDEHSNPALPESITRVMNSIIWGPRFDIFLSKTSAQVLVFIAAALIALPSEELTVEKAVIFVVCAALGLTVFTTYLCPSSYYAEYREQTEREKRRTYEEPTQLSIHLTWIVKNTLWTAICIAFWTWLLQWIRVMIPTISS